MPEQWHERFAYRSVLAGSLTDPELHLGTTSKATNWVPVGSSAGFSRDRLDFYVPNDRPKRLWCLERGRHASQLPQALALDGKMVRDHFGILSLARHEDGSPQAMSRYDQKEGTPARSRPSRRSWWTRGPPSLINSGPPGTCINFPPRREPTRGSASVSPGDSRLQVLKHLKMRVPPSGRPARLSREYPTAPQRSVFASFAASREGESTAPPQPPEPMTRAHILLVTMTSAAVAWMVILPLATGWLRDEASSRSHRILRKSHPTRFLVALLSGEGPLVGPILLLLLALCFALSRTLGAPAAPGHNSSSSLPDAGPMRWAMLLLASLGFLLMAWATRRSTGEALDMVRRGCFEIPAAVRAEDPAHYWKVWWRRAGWAGLAVGYLVFQALAG